MPLSSLLKSAAGTCPFCTQKAGILSREHPDCRRTFQAGWNEMVWLAANAARSHEFHANSLQVSLAEPGAHMEMPIQSHGHWKRAGEGQSDAPQRTEVSLTKRNPDSGGSETGWD